MKKLLFGILTFLGIGLSFCSAGDTSIDISLCDSQCLFTNGENGEFIFNFSIDSDSYFLYSRKDSTYGNMGYSNSYIYSFFDYYSVSKDGFEFVCFYFYNPNVCSGSSQGGGSSTLSDITVYYNNGNSSESIDCDGTQAIEINGLSTITSTNTFTPYYNISYTDEDNQKLTESYSKDILYLENGQFKKTYTGNNDWILTVQGNDSENIFTGYLPTFDVTGSIDKNNEFTGNVFNNFADNSLKYLLSNIPSYIQYFIILLILFLILGFVKKFRRK